MGFTGYRIGVCVKPDIVVSDEITRKKEIRETWSGGASQGMDEKGRSLHYLQHRPFNLYQLLHEKRSNKKILHKRKKKQ